jgi:hypothetical protein
MRIKAPSLKLDMELEKIVVIEGVPVLVSKVGVYEATAIMSKSDIRIVLRHLLKPRVLFSFLRLAMAQAKTPPQPPPAKIS